MNDLNVADRLSQMNEAWEQAPVQGTNDPPPPGTYQAKVERFNFFESKKSGNLTLVTELVVTNGEFSGRSCSTFHDLENPDRLGWAKGHLVLLGLESISPLSSLEDRLREVLDTPVEINVVVKDGYTNVYVNKRLGDPQARPSTNGNAVDPDDDIPF